MKKKFSMKYKVKQLKDGQWVGTTKAGYYYKWMACATEKEAIIAALKQEANDHNQKVDEIISELEKLGAIDDSDPRGFLA